MLEASSAAEILSLDLQCVEHLQKQLSAEQSGWTALARFGRAKLDGVGSHECSPDLGLSNRIYVVLRGAPGEEPCICHSAQSYYQVVQSAGSHQLHPRSVSHAFPSQAASGGVRPWVKDTMAAGAAGL